MNLLDHKHETFHELIFLLQELTQKISEMKEKAEQSEVMVQEICRDIKKLDCAKKHITTTITALHRLAMLGLLNSPIMHNTCTCPNICSAEVNILECPARVGDSVKVYCVIIQLTLIQIMLYSWFYPIGFVTNILSVVNVLHVVVKLT